MQQKSFVAILTGTLLTISMLATIQLTSTTTEAYATIQFAPQTKIEPNRGSDHIVPAKTGGEKTSLSLDSIGKVHEGSTVEFTGKLISQSGKGVARANIVIVDYSASPQSSQHDPTSDSKELAKAITDSDGFFKATWVAKAKITSEPTEAYAEFNGNSKLLGSKSDIINITVVH